MKQMKQTEQMTNDQKLSWNKKENVIRLIYKDNGSTAIHSNWKLIRSFIFHVFCSKLIQAHSSHFEMPNWCSFHFSDFVDVATFKVTQRGAPKLCHNGFEYVKDRSFHTTINWRCCLFRRKKCSARAVTRSFDNVQRVKLTHPNHSHKRK